NRCSICFLRVAPPRGYSRTQIRSNRSSDMSTQTAQVLPFPRHEAGPASRGGRWGVRLEATPRGRIVLTLVAFLLGLLVALGALLMFDVPSALAGGDGQEPISVTVEAGDTLWGYAEEHAPDGVSARGYVAQIRGLNHLPTGRVTAGQEIELPPPRCQRPLRGDLPVFLPDALSVLPPSRLPCRGLAPVRRWRGDPASSPVPALLPALLD